MNTSLSRNNETLKYYQETHAKITPIKIASSITIFNEVEALIQLIKDKLHENNVEPDKIEHLFDKVYESFPNRTKLAKRLSEIVDDYGISDEFMKKNFNKLDTIFFDICAQKAVPRGLKLFEFLLQFCTELNNEFNKISRKIGLFDSSYTHTALSLSRELSSFAVLIYQHLENGRYIDAITNERNVFEIIVLHFNKLTADGDYNRYLVMLNGLFSKFGMNVLDGPQEKIFKQFQNAISAIDIAQIGKHSAKSETGVLEEYLKDLGFTNDEFKTVSDNLSTSKPRH